MKHVWKKRIGSVILAIALTIPFAVPATAAEIPVVPEMENEAEANGKEVSEAVEISETADMTERDTRIEKLMKNIAASYEYETDPWKILTLVRGKEFTDIEALEQEAFLREAASAIQNASVYAATDIEKYVIGLSAVGCDASALDGGKLNAVEKLLSCDLTMANAAICALWALDSGQYVITGKPGITREGLIQKILAMKTPDGGWDLSCEKADSDMTGMAIQALAPYYLAADASAAGLSQDTWEQVRSAVDGALQRLSEMQFSDGTYASAASDGKGNTDSCAMVLLALVSMGIDVDSDERFIKNGQSVLDGLLSFAADEDGFLYSADKPKKNDMATEHGLRALVAYRKYRESGQPYQIYFSGDLDPTVAATSLTLSLTNKTLQIGKSVLLEAAVQPDDISDPGVIWSSSDKKVAVVNTAGRVTAKGAGKAQITATTNDGCQVSVCTITVPKPTIELNYKKLPLQIKKSTTAVKIRKSSTEAEKIVKAKSDKTSVASVKVSKGKLTVTGKKAGKAVITVTSTNGAKAKITISVKKKVSVTSLKISGAKKTMKKKEKMKLEVEKEPVTAADKITWSSSDKKVATVDSSGKVTAREKGKVTITAKASSGKKAKYKITVK